MIGLVWDENRFKYAVAFDNLLCDHCDETYFLSISKVTAAFLPFATKITELSSE